MSTSRAGWQQQKQRPGNTNTAYSTLPARTSDSRQQLGAERHLTPRSATTLGRNQGNGLVVNTNRQTHPAAPLSARTHSPATPARGRPAASPSIGRRLSEASGSAIPNYSPTTYGRGNSLIPLASARVPSTARDGSNELCEPFPGMHYSSHDGTISEVHTPHAEQRPGSRGSITSVSAFPPISGKAPYFVNSVKIDAKVVPPQLDAIKSRRRSSKAPRSSKRAQGPLHARQQARVRVRMDVDVKILHPGEQSLDLLWIGQAQTSDIESQVRVERAVYSVMHTPEYHTGPAISPLSSPRVASQSLYPTPSEYGESGEANPSSLESISAVASSSQEPASRGTLTRKPDIRARQPPVFHANAVSPYPPPPPLQRPGLGSLAAESSPVSGSDLSQSSRYESHTMASYLRAQARVSDRAGIYSDLGELPLRQSTLVRRTFSFNTESGMDELTSAMAQRPTSALGDLRDVPGLHSANQLYAERPRSSMGFVRNRLRANSESIPSIVRHPDLPDRSSLGADHSVATDKLAQVSSVRSLSEYSNEYDSTNRAPLCEFGPDLARGVFVARFYEPRLYHLTVWFSAPAGAMPTPGDQVLPAGGGLTPDSANHSAGICPDAPPSMPTLYSWEAGNVHLRGLPRSVKTTVRVRLPHRQMVLPEPTVEANGSILLGFADNQPCLSSLTALDGSSAPPATPKRQIMQVNIADVPSSIYTTRPKGSSLMASNLSSVPDAASGGRGQGCFYRVKMQQPGNIEPSLIRTESARTASTRAPVRAPSLLLYPDSPSVAPLGSRSSAEGDLAGWLNTDDSDAAENEFDFLPAPPPNAAHESPCSDMETLLDNKLQRFIDEYGHRDLASDEQPLLVDSDGNLDTDDAALGLSRPRSRSELQQARMDGANATRPSWTDFAQQQTQTDGIDYQRTELTVFKLPLADCISFSWAPRLSEYCHPVAMLDKPLEAKVPLTVSPSEDLAVAPTLGRLLPPPPLPSVSVSRHALETIFSAGSTPAGSSHIGSDTALTFPEPPSINLSALPASPKSSKASAPPPHVSIERTELGVTVQSGGLRVQSTISLRLHSPTWSTDDEAISHSDQLYDWPEYLDLEFAPLEYSVGSLASSKCAGAGVVLLHRAVAICCATQSEHPAEWLAGATPALSHGSSRVVQSELRPSCLRVWIPSTKAQLSPVIVLTVESEPATRAQLSSMLLTERLLVALPKHLVSLALPSTAMPRADVASSEPKPIKLVNRAGLWVKAAIVSPEEEGDDQAPTTCHTVAIERRPASSMPGIAPAYNQQQQFVTAYVELSNDGAVLTPLTSPTASSVSVIVGDGGNQGELGLSVQVILKCSLVTFIPWRIQLGSGASSMATPCLALRLPDAAAGCSPWVVSGLELTSATGDNGRVASTQLICLGSTLLGIPLAGRRQLDNTLGDEAVIDTVRCVLTMSIARDQLLAAKSLSGGQEEHVAAGLGVELPLPTLLFGASDVASVCKALDNNDSCFEYSSIARLSGSLLSSVSVSVMAPCLQANGDTLPTPRLAHNDTIICPIGASLDTNDDDLLRQASPLGMPLTEHRFQLSDSTPLKLQLLPTLPEARPELVTRYVDTSDLEPPPPLEIGDVSPELEPDALPTSYCSVDEEEADDGGASDLPTPDSSASAHEAWLNSTEGSACGSLRNRHVRARVDQPTDLGGLFQPPPAMETDPLLLCSEPLEATSAISMGDQAARTTRSWRAALMALRTVICMVVFGALVLLAKDRLFNSPIYWGWPVHDIAAVVPEAAQMPLAMAVPETSAPIDLSTHPIYISVVTPAPPEADPRPASTIRVRARSKHSDTLKHQQAVSASMTTTAPEATTTALAAMSNDGTHAFAAPTDASPLLGWLYKSVIGSVLELLGL